MNKEAVETQGYQPGLADSVAQWVMRWLEQNSEEKAETALVTDLWS